MSFSLPPVVVRATGKVYPPADLVAVARRELRPGAFDTFIRRTAGKPTADELVAAVQADRLAAQE